MLLRIMLKRILGQLAKKQELKWEEYEHFWKDKNGESQVTKSINVWHWCFTCKKNDFLTLAIKDFKVEIKKFGHLCCYSCQNYNCSSCSEIIEKEQEELDQLKTKIYVDYALNNKIGIHCDNPYLRVSFQPKQKINYQIEGEALAIKQGVIIFLNNRGEGSNQLIIYTDNATLLNSFSSLTQAGKWWREAHELAEKNNMDLELRFVLGKDNLADVLTRDATDVQSKKEKKLYYYRKWLVEQKKKK